MPEDLAGELIGRATQGLQQMDLGKVTWIAATLLRNLERDLGRWLAGERRRSLSHQGGDQQDPDPLAAPGPGPEARIMRNSISPLLVSTRRSSMPWPSRV